MVNVISKEAMTEVKTDSIEKPMNTIMEALACCKALSVYIRDTFGENGDKVFKEGLRNLVLEADAKDDAGKIISADTDEIRRQLAEKQKGSV